TPEFTCQGNAEFVDMVIGDGSYYRYIQVVLPVVPKDLGGSSFDNQEASVVWAFNNSSTYMEDVVASPEGSFAITSFDAGVCVVKSTKTTTLCPDVNFLCIASGTGAADLLKWTVKPVKGLHFTPTSISFYIGRDGTDGAGKDVTVRGQVGDGQEVVFAAITPHRNNKTQETDKLGSDDAYTIKFDYTLTPEQQQALTSGEGFSLVLNNGYATNKALMVSDVHINGVLNGTVEAVEKFSLKLASNLEDACKLSVYPAADEYELGTEVAISAVRNFGYKFINWTDAAGNEVSTELSFKYVINSDTELTANFEKLTTYALDYGVEGGANLYMVQPQPAPVVIDGKNMYEEGTVVTLTASGNDILTFTNWSDGGTFAETKVTMDGDKSLTAVYSAVDYIVGWDFYLAGANGRPADFASTPENESATLVLRDAEGNTQGWLDKSTVAAGGYESFAGAAVNWKKLGQYYYQTKINARDFSNIKVQAKMMYNYNAYTTQVLEYSLDGETWNEVTRILMEGAKTQNEIAGALPAAADHAENLFIRWRPDLDGAVDGTAAADNDGTAISAIYITADAEVYNDGVAPKLISSVPADNAAGASSTGRIVLNFDEKVKLTAAAKATLNGQALELAVSGKTVTANYRNLDYATEYVFNLAAGSVSDAAGNTMSEAVKITFTTMSRPTVAKVAFDKEVTNAAEFLAALEAANTRSDKGTRYRIFLHNGTYDLGKATLTGISASNISLIGESQEGVVIVNKPEVEGIGVTATLFNTSTGLYMQDITIKNDYPYANTTGRAVCLQDKGNKTVAKRVTLLSYQDTYYSNNSSSRFYWEDSEIHGTVDFLCGGGDVYYNRVNLVVENRSGNVIAAPNGQLKYGYVFLDCEINCPAGAESVVNGSYRLGRPWGANARAQYINTRMNVIPAADGWGEMGGNKPEVFAEYNSTDKNGIAVDLASRKVKFDGGTQASAVLTEAQVAELSVENVMGGSDEWNPLGLTEQAPIVTNLSLENGLLTWDNSDYAACWAVCRNGQVIAFTLEPEFEIAESRADEAVYSVRAANEMGGLGDAVEVGGSTSGIDSVGADAEVVSTVFYNLQGIRVGNDAKGLLIKVDTLASGRTVTTKVIVK
ncbi:pectinesterase family protein, partial [uncultured Duncaniella sp.]